MSRVFPVWLVVSAAELRLRDFHPSFRKDLTGQVVTVSRLYSHNKACSVTDSYLHQQQRGCSFFLFRLTLSDRQHAETQNTGLFTLHRIFTEYELIFCRCYWRDISLCSVTVTYFMLLNSDLFGVSLYFRLTACHRKWKQVGNSAWNIIF